MKGFKPTGNGPKLGHSFSSQHGFSGSTGMVKNIGPYTRKTPCFAEGGSALTKRDKPATELDVESGGKTPLRPGFKKGGLKLAIGGPVTMKAGGKNWIASAVGKNPGALHRALHVPQGDKIPAVKLTKATQSSNPRVAKEANLAKTLGKMHKAKGGSVGFKKEPMYGRGC